MQNARLDEQKLDSRLLEEILTSSDIPPNGRNQGRTKEPLLKSRNNALPTKVHLVKAVVFPVVMYGCESWIIKKAEPWRTGAFELWCWRLLTVPWTERRSNLSILKEINSEYSLEGLTLKWKLQYFGHLMQRIDSFEKTLMLGRIEGGRRRRQQRMSWLDCITDLMDMSLSEWTPGVGDEQGGLVCWDSWDLKELHTTKGLNWTETKRTTCLPEVLRDKKRLSDFTN